jgi:hypothetical protein
VIATPSPNVRRIHASAGGTAHAATTSAAATPFPSFMINRDAITRRRSVFASPGVGFNRRSAPLSFAIAPWPHAADTASLASTPLASARFFGGRPGPAMTRGEAASSGRLTTESRAVPMARPDDSDRPKEEIR